MRKRRPYLDTTKRMMKVAVTGSTGFIGRHAELSMYPVEVIVIARQLTADMAQLPQVKVVQLDLQDVSSDTFSLMKGPDVLIH